MTDTAQSTSPYTGRPVSEWIDPIRLVDVEGDNVGEIVEVNPDFVVVKEGHWLAEDEYYYVPRGQVTEGTDSWSLTVDKDDLEKNYSGQWAQPPQDSAWSQDTYRSGQPIDSYSTGDEQAGKTRLRRYEEQLQAQTTPQQVGEVTVTKRVVEDHQTIEVPVRREEVRVERRPLDGSATYDANGAVGDQNASAEAFQGDTIRVPVMEEQVQVQKVARPVEEVEISKVTTQDTRQVDDTIRREEFDVNDPTGRTNEIGQTTNR
jgi:uncharacterized protein (TIGR02271 family)